MAVIEQADSLGRERYLLVSLSATTFGLVIVILFPESYSCDYPSIRHYCRSGSEVVGTIAPHIR
jgi:hypothetical protein